MKEGKFPVKLYAVSTLSSIKEINSPILKGKNLPPLSP